VVALTKRAGETPEKYFRRIRATGPEAVFLKLADRLSNVRACVSGQPNDDRLKKYRHEQPLLESILDPGKDDNGYSTLQALRAELEKSQTPS
jgi:hypothetical protein